jgi:hypothetical protein
MKQILILAALAGALMAEQPTGPAVGARVPAFEAVDQNSASRSLDSLLGPKGAILVFHRSADW